MLTAGERRDMRPAFHVSEPQLLDRDRIVGRQPLNVRCIERDSPFEIHLMGHSDAKCRSQRIANGWSTEQRTAVTGIAKETAIAPPLPIQVCNGNVRC
jgi:hypothetical protein